MIREDSDGPMQYLRQSFSPTPQGRGKKKEKVAAEGELQLLFIMLFTLTGRLQTVIVGNPLVIFIKFQVRECPGPPHRQTYLTNDNQGCVPRMLLLLTEQGRGVLCESETAARKQQQGSGRDSQRRTGLPPASTKAVPDHPDTAILASQTPCRPLKSTSHLRSVYLS